MGDLGALIEQTKALMGELISKPKMSDKLLGKPPFRFLHDTVSAIIATTGFAEGLFPPVEMDSANISDKDAKIAYLSKIFQLVGICKGNPIDVRAAKVVSGLEPENTNMFLIALAECAADRNIDNEQAVMRCLNGEAPGQGPLPLRSGGGGMSMAAESKHADMGDVGAKHMDDFKPITQDRDMNSGGGAKDIEVRIPPEMEMIAPDRGKSRGGTRGGKPNNAVADAGLSGGMGSAIAPKLDHEIEKCDGSDVMTQQLLGALISRPKLTEKLLSKPPFRFLHDIIMEVIRSTGFGSNLYTPEESDHANVTDKEQKIQFLEKIIRLVGLQLNTLVVANPSKIVAGREPQDTNNFLQLLAVAAHHLPDSTVAVRTVLGDEPASAPTPAVVPARSAPVQQQQPERASEKEIDTRLSPQQQQAPAQFDRDREASWKQPKDEAFAGGRSGSAGAGSREITMTADEKPNLQDNTAEGEETAGEKRSSRPTTAGRRPPRVKDGAKALQSKDIAPAVKKTEGIIIDGQADEEEDEDAIVDETRLADEIHSTAEAKGSGGSSAAAADSKLVKDIMSRQAEQEAAGRSHNKINEADEEAKGSPQDSAAGGSGIRLGRLKKTGIDKKAGGPGGASGFGETDLEKMRSSIQLLVQHTGPLGTCMDYVQEDVSLMTAELHRWEEDCRKYEAEYEEAKRKTKESLHPLRLQLADVTDQIFEVMAKISSAKAANARNDDKIQQILKLSSTA